MILSLTDIISFDLIDIKGYTLSVGQLAGLVIFLLVVKIIMLIAKKIESKFVKNNEKDQGRYHSVYLIFSYFIWVIALVISLEILGAKITILLASGAALLVGIGMGLQNIFNDFISGIFILFEGTMTVNDVIEVDGIIGRVTKITLRNTQVITRDDYYLIIPNHKFVAEKIINWSHVKDVSRYKVSVGVAYGSDTAKVVEILTDCARGFKNIVDKPSPTARFEEFGDSSLNFNLYFYSHENFYIEKVKGDLRLLIDKKFREHNITIPFPQRDLHIKSDSTK